ncbi:MAG: hypothetical protein JW776_01355 [Candidatus Lokiarchaeota archaeon]|nr:hypothetical protein [Candidatus Lokiarchaeota archaeon]
MSSSVWWVEFIGGIGVIFSLLNIFFVMKYNSYHARIAEIQNEVEHKVITTGPYRVVRHPMYSASLLMFNCSPLLLSFYYQQIYVLPLVKFNERRLFR